MPENRNEAYSYIQILHEMLHELKKNIMSVLGIFGSYVRGEQKPGSDLDILVDVTM